MCQRHLFENYSYSIGQCEIENLEKQLHKKFKYERTMNEISEPLDIK